MNPTQVTVALAIFLFLALMFRLLSRSKRTQSLNASRQYIIQALYAGESAQAKEFCKELHVNASLYDDAEGVLFAYYGEAALTGDDCNVLDNHDDDYICEVNALACLARADWQQILDETEAGISAKNPFLVALRFIALVEFSRWDDVLKAMQKEEVLRSIGHLPNIFREHLLCLLKAIAGLELTNERWPVYVDYCRRLVSGEDGGAIDGRHVLLSSLRLRQRHLLVEQSQVKPAPDEVRNSLNAILLQQQHFNVAS